MQMALWIAHMKSNQKPDLGKSKFRKIQKGEIYDLKRLKAFPMDRVSIKIMSDAQWG